MLYIILLAELYGHMSKMLLTYAFYELATVPAMYVHPYGTRKVRNRLMASRKEDTPAPTKYV